MEMRTLAECMQSARSELVAVYGRRRIGKTFLIKEYFKSSFAFCFVGTRDVSKSVQLCNFATSLQKQFRLDCKPSLQNWFEAFSLLESLLEKRKAKGKKVLFIDEMPWMDSVKSDFVPALELFWNGWANMRNDIVLIACGSATSWMVDKVFHNKGGLFNRVTRHLYLRNRMAIFREQTGTRYGTQLTMITTFGVLPNKHYSVVDSEVTLDDLF